MKSSQLAPPVRTAADEIPALRRAWRYLRAVVRIALFAGVTLISYGQLLLLLPFKRRFPRFHLRQRNRVFRTWSRLLTRIAGMRVTVEGRPPEGRFFLVVNHLGYMDIMLLGAHIDAAFVAKADLKAWPLLGTIFAAADTIFIDRGRRSDVVRVGKRLEGCLDRGLGVLVFPEGAATKGDRVLRFKSALFQLPARLELPVTCAALSYRTPEGEPPPHLVVCWWGGMDFLPHIWRLMQMPYFEATLRFGDTPVQHPDRKELARRAHAVIDERFVPVVRGTSHPR